MRASARDWLRPAGFAALSTAAVFALWWFFVTTLTGQVLDAVAFDGSMVGSHLVAAKNERLLDLVSVGAIALAMGLVAVVAILRRRWVLALEATVVIAGANVTTRGLKYHILAERPYLVPSSNDYIEHINTLPSGHTTAAASACVAILLVVWPKLRVPTALAGAAVMFAFGWSTMAAQWHRQADVLAALFVCLAWAYAAVAAQALRWQLIGRHGAEHAAVHRPSRLWPGLMVAVGAVALIGAGYGFWRLRALTSVEVSRSVAFSAYVAATAAVGGIATAGMGVLLRLVQLADARRDA